MSINLEIDYHPRPQFRPFHKRTQRWGCIVAHRRAGKTVACVAELNDRAIKAQKRGIENARYAYLAPLYNQAKEIAWDYLKHYAGPLIGQGLASANESELRVDYWNGARVRLYGADNPDRLRGIYLDGVILDEYADMDPRVWTEVIRPALADRQGWAVFIGTPKGHNAFHEIYANAQSHSDWYCESLKASSTGLLPLAELDEARRMMSPDQYEQEFECSFEAAIQGAYYADQFKYLDEENRIGNVPWEPKVPVVTAWDLGIGDSTAIWFGQVVGREVRLIDYYEASGVGLDHYANALKSRRYVYGEYYLPHDADVSELGTGKTRVQTLRELGINPIVLPRAAVDDGINAARMLLPMCWFDKTKCDRGLEALRQYRREFDDKLKVFKQRPLHDWSSHAADAFRYLAMGLPDRLQVKPQPDRYSRRRDHGAQSWMSA